MAIQLEKSWFQQLEQEFSKSYMQQLNSFLQNERFQNQRVYPHAKDIFNAFSLLPFHNVKVVILGQDPYHGDGQAHGLSFSVPNGVKIPPSLMNIFKELSSDIPNFKIPLHGNLTSWATQGVLLLNATLTVREAQPASHQGKGWELFTDTVIQTLSQESNHVVFLLWGSFAQAKSQLIDSQKHLVLISAHPSPLSAHRGFLGCRHFSTTNQYLAAHGKDPIVWHLS